MGGAEGVRERRAQAAALLVDGAGGGEFEVVRDLLAGPLRTPALLLRGAALHETSMTLDVDAAVLEIDGRLVRPVVVWARHVSAGALLVRSLPQGTVTPLRAAAWSDFLRQVRAAGETALPGRAPTGPRQLADAARLGVRTPRTLVTTDASAAAGSLGASPVIVKTPDFRVLEPDPHTWPAHLPAVFDGPVPADAPGHPVVVQEHVPHSRELRVYHLDGAICAFEVGKPGPASPWTEPERVTVTRTACPRDAVGAVRALCAHWGLRYGAFDLLVTPDGEPVFLEANPDGDWLWFERRAGWRGVSFAAAVMVRELYVRSIRDTRDTRSTRDTHSTRSTRDTRGTRGTQ
jgi:hypothetical protein